MPEGICSLSSNDLYVCTTGVQLMRRWRTNLFPFARRISPVEDDPSLCTISLLCFFCTICILRTPFYNFNILIYFSLSVHVLTDYIIPLLIILYVSATGASE